MVKRSIGIDMGRFHLRAVQVAQQPDGLRVEKVFARPTRRSTDSPIDMLRALTTEQGFDRHAEVTACLPHHAVFFADIEVDATTLQELRAGHASSLRDDFPIAAEKAVVQICSSRPSPNGRHATLVATTSIDLLGEELARLAEGKIHPSWIETPITAVHTAIGYNHPDCNEGVALLLVVDESVLSLAVVQEGTRRTMCQLSDTETGARHAPAHRHIARESGEFEFGDYGVDFHLEGDWYHTTMGWWGNMEPEDYSRLPMGLGFGGMYLDTVHLNTSWGEKVVDRYIGMVLLESSAAFGVEYRGTDSDLVYRSDIIGLVAARLSSRPVIATIHGFVPIDSRLRLYEQCDRFALRFFDLVLPVSDRIGQALRASGVRRERITTVRNAIATGDDEGRKCSVSPLSLFKRDGDFLIGIVGRLSPEKNIPGFLEAARRLSKRYGHLRFMVVGEGPERECLEGLTMRMGLDGKVRFTGFVEEMEEVYSLLDMLVITSSTEGVPLSILEAMKHGIPVVSTGVGGIPEVIEDGVDGLMVEAGDTGALCRAVETLVVDGNRYMAISRNARKRVLRDFDRLSWTRRIESCYLSMLNKREEASNE